MIRSMTGFARASTTVTGGTLVWEVRSVNHRYVEVSLRVPDEWRAAEGAMRTCIQTCVRRGKVDATLQLRTHNDAQSGLEVNDALLEALIVRAHEVTDRATSHGGSLTPPSPLDLLRWPGVLKERPGPDASVLLDTAIALLQEALTQLNQTRASEGERIAAMIAGRCRQLAALVDGVRVRVPQVQARLRARLEERLGQLDLATEPNRDRFEQELTLALSRMDVDEELDRLVSHLREVETALAGTEPAGRRLDFLMQEFNREANTLSSKSQDTETTRLAVDMKVLIEQMREQVQNIE